MNIDRIADNTVAARCMIQQHLNISCMFPTPKGLTQLPMQIATHPSASPFHLSFKTIHKLLRHNACVINHCCPFLFTAVRLLRHCIIATLIQVHYCFRKVRQMRRSLLSYFCAHTSKPANVPLYNTKGKGQEEQGSV